MQKIGRISFLGVIIIFTIMFLTQITFAANFTISVENLTYPSGINSVAFWFDVDNDFQFLSTDVESTVGAAIPAGGTVGWSPDSSSGSSLFKIDAIDMDDALNLGGQNLLNGTIFSFDYSGQIFDFNRVEFGVGSTNIYGTDIVLTSFNANGATFAPSAVPIPGAVWLLGSGLFGLVAIRRRRV